MTVSAAMIADVRRMVNEPTEAIYTDEIITSIIEKYPVIDELGTLPYYWDYAGGVPTKVENTAWVDTYNLNAVSADIWEEKAATLAGRFDFSADGGSYTRSQAYTQAFNMAKYYRGRSGIKSIRLLKSPEEPEKLSNRAWIGNLPEVD